MKRFLIFLLVCLLLTGCAQTIHHCPICDATVEDEVDPEYVLEWLEHIDYLEDRGYFHEDDLPDLAAQYVDDYPEYAKEWLENRGYVVADPEGGEIQELARDIYRDDPQFLANDLLEDEEILDYLKSAGWTIVPPGGDYWERVPTNYTPVDESCVYWVKSGYAYHSTKDCVALKNSKEILHGTLKEAQASGHDHPCSKCIEP